ncbi:hypothetical protein ACFVZD_05710 [Streptomyces sp. NPDC058287]|uniref:hypothetical protein n=1 Tax=unclassified Streptomyces TaxID=2593676 RepID=UPI0036E4851D
MRVPEGVRKTANVLLCLAAVFGIGWGGKEIWQVLSARQQIDAACGGLVPAGRVLALSVAGGTVTHRVSYDPLDLDDLASGQGCELFSTEAGEKHGSDGARMFFVGSVGVLPRSREVIADNPSEELVDYFDGRAYPSQPLGGGIAGVVDDSGVAVRLSCPEGKVGTRPIKALWARAELLDPKRWFMKSGQLNASDRTVLADTAVLTANNLAERLGCADRLPDAPDDIPALPEGPSPAARAEGTCAWYGKAGYAARGSRYPDQVVESRTDARLWDEQCGLILSEGRAKDLFFAIPDEHERLDEPDHPGKWFVSLHTYSGPDATNVLLTSTSFDERPEPASPGKAGRSTEDPIWWASSVCDGRPQIHTMTLALGYDRVARPRMAKVFRSYVDDVTRRRGCSRVRFPASSTFRADTP